MPLKKPYRVRKTAIALGFRSGLEEDVARDLQGLAEYESLEVPWVPKPKVRVYHPDFALPNGILIETKGRFITADRQKHLQVKEQYPDLDLRFVFSNPHQTISKSSKTTYAVWCEKYGFKWSGVKDIGRWMRWTSEPLDEKSLAVIAHLKQEMAKPKPKKGRKTT